MTDYQPKTVIAGHVERELVACGLEALTTRLHRLVAFKEMTITGDVPETALARDQVEALLAEIAALGALPFLTDNRTVAHSEFLGHDAVKPSMP